jgi:hypothetical protein
MMKNNLESHNFSETELEMLDASLMSVPSEHLQGSALREFRRDTYLEREGRTYPTVMALYSAESGSAILYDGAFLGTFGSLPHPVPLPDFAIHCAVGCSLAYEESILSGWSRAAEKTATAPAPVLILEKDQIDAALKFERGSLAVDITSLPSGVDFAVTYAAFCSFGDLLKEGMPAIHRYLQSGLFGGAEPSREQDLHLHRIVRG